MSSTYLIQVFAPIKSGVAVLVEVGGHSLLFGRLAPLYTATIAGQRIVDDVVIVNVFTGQNGSSTRTAHGSRNELNNSIRFEGHGSDRLTALPSVVSVLAIWVYYSKPWFM